MVHQVLNAEHYGTWHQLPHLSKIINKNMKNNQIKGRTFVVHILGSWSDGKSLCFLVYNETLGRFVITDCYYAYNPRIILYDCLSFIGSVSFLQDDGLPHYYIVILVISKKNPGVGTVYFI